MTNLPAHSWSTSQLVEFLAVLAEQSDELTAQQVAVERVLESLDAEVVVLGAERRLNGMRRAR